MLSQPAEKGALIDLWGTILYPAPSLEEYTRERARKILQVLLELGIDTTEQKIYETYRATRSLADKIRNFTMLELSLEGEVILLLDKLGIEPREETVRKLSEAFIHPYVSMVKPAPNVKELLETIKALGFRLILASNTMSTAHSLQLLKTHGLYELFDYLAFSDSIGFRKPHPKFFSHIISVTGIVPVKSFFLGDEEADIKGAKQLGFKTIAYTGFHPYTGNTQPDCIAENPERVKECIKSLGI